MIPVLSDDVALRRLLGQIEADLRVEVIISRAGTSGQPASFAIDREDVTVIESEPGRARQMNEGARIARGEWLFFLHADSNLPLGWLNAFEAAPPRAIGGWFRFGVDDEAWQARVIERGVAWRVRLFRLPYGDQGLFVRRQTFEAMGGYREMPLMEDVEFVRRLVERGPVVEVPQTLRTSPRRWRRDGWFRRSARNLLLVALYLSGVSSSRLARWYSR